MVLSECVLVYLEPNPVRVLKKEVAKYFENIAWIDYEMFNSKDAFGKVMVQNFEVS